MKNKIKNLGIVILSAGVMLLGSTLPVNASYTYHSPEANGVEHRIEKEYGKVKKIRVIEVSGKDSMGIVEDKAREITYEDGTIVTYRGNYSGNKTVERVVDGKKVTERLEKPYKSNWILKERSLQYEKDGAEVEEWFTTMDGDELVLRHIKVEKQTNSGKTIEWYWGNDYRKGEKPDVTSFITETIIYPKKTSENNSTDYYHNQNEGLDGKKFFTHKSYWSIERKLVEEKNEEGKVSVRRFETILTDFDGMTEKRIEQDYELFKRPTCDGKIDFRQSIKQKLDGTYEMIDYDGDGVPDEEVCKKVTTIYLE